MTMNHHPGKARILISIQGLIAIMILMQLIPVHSKPTKPVGLGVVNQIQIVNQNAEPRSWDWLKEKLGYKKRKIMGYHSSVFLCSLGFDVGCAGPLPPYFYIPNPQVIIRGCPTMPPETFTTTTTTTPPTTTPATTETPSTSTSTQKPSVGVFFYHQNYERQRQYEGMGISPPVGIPYDNHREVPYDTYGYDSDSDPYAEDEYHLNVDY